MERGGDNNISEWQAETMCNYGTQQFDRQHAKEILTVLVCHGKCIKGDHSF